MSEERVFSFSRGVLETTGAGAGGETGAGVRALVSRTALKTLCKSSTEYLGILVVVIRVIAMGGFFFESPAGWSDNLSSNSEGEKKLGKVTEGVTEGRSQWGCPRPQTDVILELISSKNTLPNWLANLLGMEKLEL